MPRVFFCFRWPLNLSWKMKIRLGSRLLFWNTCRHPDSPPPPRWAQKNTTSVLFSTSAIAAFVSNLNTPKTRGRTSFSWLDCGHIQSWFTVCVCVCVCVCVRASACVQQPPRPNYSKATEMNAGHRWRGLGAALGSLVWGRWGHWWETNVTHLLLLHMESK